MRVFGVICSAERHFLHTTHLLPESKSQTYDVTFSRTFADKLHCIHTFHIVRMLFSQSLCGIVPQTRFVLRQINDMLFDVQQKKKKRQKSVRSISVCVRSLLLFFLLYCLLLLFAPAHNVYLINWHDIRWEMVR